jgi:hypothetical protein
MALRWRTCISVTGMQHSSVHDSACSGIYVLSAQSSSLDTLCITYRVLLTLIPLGF